MFDKKIVKRTVAFSFFTALDPTEYWGMIRELVYLFLQTVKKRPQADHPLLVGAVVDRNLTNDLLLFIEENTYEQYGGYNLFQNAEFKANFSIKV